MNHSNNLHIGRQGEALAGQYLEKQGYQILHRNVSLGKDEIDLIAFDPANQSLVFVEVKARSTLSQDFRPELNIDRRKRRALFRAARHWVADHAYTGGYRIDVVCIAAGKVIDHLVEIAEG